MKKAFSKTSQLGSAHVCLATLASKSLFQELKYATQPRLRVLCCTAAPEEMSFLVLILDFMLLIHQGHIDAWASRK
eukprot:scaffold66294_cov15-Tisochrysis_lutea.AAC.1